MGTNDSQSSADLKECQFLWEEYKYRHDLIWQRIFIFTTAVTLISIIPYIELDIARRLGPWILIASLLAFLLTGFVLLVMRNELALFRKIKEAYRRKQNRFLDYDLKHMYNEKSDFELFVMIYFGVLMLLVVINGLIVWRVWLPRA